MFADMDVGWLLDCCLYRQKVAKDCRSKMR